jgi:ribosomal protein S18 acetylase RimI-like enzyme
MGGKTEAVVDRWLGGSPNYYILKQIATDPRQRKLGIGESLAHHFLTLAPPPLDVFLTIVVKPANPASERFHRRLGFTPVIDATSIGAHGETFPSRIWRRVPAGA